MSSHTGDIPYTLILVGSIVGAWFGGVPGITIDGILGTWIVIFLFRRNEKHDDPSTE